MRHSTNILAGMVLLLALAGCKPAADIQGVTSMHELEGKMLYLRVYADGDLQTVDSARIQHGKFRFRGNLPDSAVMASMFIGDRSIMPVVLDGSPLTITLNQAERKVEGSELNDSLFAFIARKTVLDQQLDELPRRESRMILDGMNHDDILRLLSAEAAELNEQEDELVTAFIKANMHNCLAPGVFMVVTSNFPYPILNTRIEEIVALASPEFLANAYVQDYLRMARENMEKWEEE